MSETPRSKEVDAGQVFTELKLYAALVNLESARKNPGEKPRRDFVDALMTFIQLYDQEPSRRQAARGKDQQYYDMLKQVLSSWAQTVDLIVACKNDDFHGFIVMSSVIEKEVLRRLGKLPVETVDLQVATDVATFFRRQVDAVVRLPSQGRRATPVGTEAARWRRAS